MIDRQDMIALHTPGECPRQDALVKELSAPPETPSSRTDAKAGQAARQ